MRMRSALIAGALLVTVGAGAVRAIEQRPLPVFHVAGSGGAVVTSTQLAVADQWLLLYVAPGNRSCDLLLAALKDWQSAALIQHTVIIVGGAVQPAQAYLQQALPSEVSAIPWYADAQGEAWSTLRLTGTPVLIGVKKGVIQWSISGVLNDPTALESAVKTWVGQ
jgi:hypothetical protein